MSAPAKHGPPKKWLKFFQMLAEKYGATLTSKKDTKPIIVDSYKNVRLPI